MPLRPDIRFCTAADGAKIAVGDYGRGPPLVRAGTWLTHVEYEATSPLSAHWCEELARRHRYITYDSRGCGLSDRQVDDLSLDLRCEDPLSDASENKNESIRAGSVVAAQLA